MKKIILSIGLILFPLCNAQAVCTGGFDGISGDLSGCSEMGGLGDLVYERDASGRILRKRTDAEIKVYLTTVVEDRMKRRGVTMKGVTGSPSIQINAENILFDVYNQNGDKIYTYNVDVKSGVLSNEKPIVDSRKNVDNQRIKQKKFKNDRLSRLQALGDKIKKEELDAKAAAKKK